MLRRHWSKRSGKLIALLSNITACQRWPFDEAAIINNRVHNLLLERYGDLGDRIESIEHHPAYHACGKAIYEDGKVIAAYKEEEPNLLAQALFYISSHVGEAGHNCPVACTAGVVKACAPREPGASGGVSSRATHPPLRRPPRRRAVSHRGSRRLRCWGQLCRGPSRWRSHGHHAVEDLGEKWFCSNADADLILMTARSKMGPTAPETRTLLVPASYPIIRQTTL